ncbi:unnamed protein product, partial [Tetraodon nigroviridis]
EEERKERERVREEEERKVKLQIYVFVLRCIAYPFNAKQPTDMARRQQKVSTHLETPGGRGRGGGGASVTWSVQVWSVTQPEPSDEVPPKVSGASEPADQSGHGPGARLDLVREPGPGPKEPGQRRQQNLAPVGARSLSPGWRPRWHGDDQPLPEGEQAAAPGGEGALPGLPQRGDVHPGRRGLRQRAQVLLRGKRHTHTHTHTHTSMWKGVLRCSPMFLPCSSRVPPVFLSCSSRVPLVFLPCSSRVPPVFLSCSSRVPPVFLSCSSRVPPVFLPCSSPCSSRVPPMFLPCSSRVPHRVPPVFLPCSSHVPPVFLPCSSHVHTLSRCDYRSRFVVVTAAFSGNCAFSLPQFPWKPAPVLVEVEVFWVTFEGHGRPLLDTLVTGTFRVRRRCDGGTDRGRGFLRSERVTRMVQSGGCSANDFREVFKKNIERRVRSLPEINGLSKETVLSSWMAKFDAIYKGEEHLRRPPPPTQLGAASELILSKEQLFQMFQQILGVRKVEHQLLYNACQPPSVSMETSRVLVEVEVFWVTFEGHGRPLLDTLVTGTFRVRRRCDGGTDRGRGFLRSERVTRMVQSGGCSANDFREVFKKNIERRVRSLPEINGLSKETVLSSWMAKFDAIYKGEEHLRRPPPPTPLGAASELILSKEQLFQMFQQILGVRKLDNQDEQAAQIRRELDGRLQLAQKVSRFWAGSAGGAGSADGAVPPQERSLPRLVSADMEPLYLEELASSVSLLRANLEALPVSRGGAPLKQRLKRSSLHSSFLDLGEEGPVLAKADVLLSFTLEVRPGGSQPASSSAAEGGGVFQVVVVEVQGLRSLAPNRIVYCTMEVEGGEKLQTDQAEASRPQSVALLHHSSASLATCGAGGRWEDGRGDGLLTLTRLPFTGPGGGPGGFNPSWWRWGTQGDFTTSQPLPSVKVKLFTESTGVLALEDKELGRVVLSPTSSSPKHAELHRMAVPKNSPDTELKIKLAVRMDKPPNMKHSGVSHHLFAVGQRVWRRWKRRYFVLVQVTQYTFAMCSYREKKAEPQELMQLEGYTVDYCDPQPGLQGGAFFFHALREGDLVTFSCRADADGFRRMIPSQARASRPTSPSHRHTTGGPGTRLRPPELCLQVWTCGSARKWRSWSSAPPSCFDHAALFTTLQRCTLQHRMNDSFSCLRGQRSPVVQGWFSPGQVFVLDEYCARYGVRGCRRHLSYLSDLMDYSENNTLIDPTLLHYSYAFCASHVHGNSPGQVFVLDEYCARYGVRGCRRHLSYLSDLMDYSENNALIDPTLLHYSYAFCASHVHGNRPDGVGAVTLEERDGFLALRRRLMVLLENHITHFRYCFPFGRPDGALKATLALQERVLMKDATTPVPPEDLRNLVRRCLQEAARLNYSQLLQYAHIKAAAPPTSERRLEEVLRLGELCLDVLQQNQEHHAEAFSWWPELMTEHAETFLSLYRANMDAALQAQPIDSWNSFPLFQLLNNFLRSDAHLSGGSFHRHLQDVFVPLVVRYIDLMESSIAQSLHRGFQQETWEPLKNGSATSEDLFWKLDALQMFLADLRWPEPDFAKHLEQRLKLMAGDMVDACVRRTRAAFDVRLQKVGGSSDWRLPPSVCTMFNVLMDARRRTPSCVCWTRQLYHSRIDVLIEETISDMISCLVTKFSTVLHGLLSKLSRYDEGTLFSSILSFTLIICDSQLGRASAAVGAVSAVGGAVAADAGSGGAATNMCGGGREENNAHGPSAAASRHGRRAAAQPIDSWNSFPLFQLLNNFLRSDAHLSGGSFHRHLQDVFVPLVVRYIDLMESSIAQSLHRGFQQETWEPLKNGSATSEDLFWKLDALQMFLADLRWPEPDFAKHLEQRLKLMAGDMVDACVRRTRAAFDVRLQKVGGSSDWRLPPSVCTMFNVLMDARRRSSKLCVLDPGQEQLYHSRIDVLIEETISDMISCLVTKVTWSHLVTSCQVTSTAPPISVLFDVCSSPPSSMASSPNSPDTMKAPSSPPSCPSRAALPRQRWLSLTPVTVVCVCRTRARTWPTPTSASCGRTRTSCEPAWGRSCSCRGSLM